MARRPLLITKIMKGQKRSAMPSRASRSRKGHKGKVLRFMRPVLWPHYLLPSLSQRSPPDSGRKALIELEFVAKFHPNANNICPQAGSSACFAGGRARPFGPPPRRFASREDFPRGTGSSVYGGG